MSLLLCIGITLATFRASGYIPSAIQLLKIIVKTGAMIIIVKTGVHRHLLRIKYSAFCTRCSEF